jgi:hypothetical protein
MSSAPPATSASPDQVGPIDIPDLKQTQTAPDDPIARYVALLRGGHGTTSSPDARSTGFVFAVRAAESLQSLQEASPPETPDSLFCLTLRYRLKSGAVLGTLLTALLRDLNAIRAGSGTLLGIAWPEVAAPGWHRLVESPLGAFVEDREAAGHGRLDADEVAELLRLLGSDEVLPWGTRLVLLAEVVGADGDHHAADEWEASGSLLLGVLPYRVGLVVSGVPRGFTLPKVESVVEVPTLGGVAVQQADAAQVQYRASGLVADRATAADHLGRAKLAASTAEFLLHPQTAAPFTIGLFGAWGKGKSSFIEQLNVQLRDRAVEGLHLWMPQSSAVGAWIRWLWMRQRVRWERWRLKTLEAAAAPGPEDPARIALAKGRLADWRIVTVTFNAWQFEDAKQTWAGLASVISERIEGALPWWRRLWLRVLYAWRNYRGELILNVGVPVALLVLGAAILAISPGLQRTLGGLVEGKTTDGPAVKLVRSLLPAASAAFLALLGWWRLAEGVKPLSERLMAYAQRPDYRGEMGYQHQVIQDLRFLLRQLQRARPGCRVLVYVDDLDRCSDEKVVELLRATNLVLAACDLFVLLAVDDAMLRKAIAARYKDDKSAADPMFADNYLRKIVQISLFLPSTAADARVDMVSQFFSEATRQAWLRNGTGAAAEEKKQEKGAAEAGAGGLEYDLATVLPSRTSREVEDTREELAALHDCREYLPDNARELKRLVNTHRFVKILLSSGSGAWSDERQRALVKWLVFCANWPDLVDDLLAIARTDPPPADCLALLAYDPAAYPALPAFIQIAPPLSGEDLRGDFAVAARLSQVVYDSVPGAAAKPAP